MNPLNEKLLQQKITDLPFSEDLKNILTFNHLLTLRDVLEIELYNWHKHLPGFNYHDQQEIVNYLQQNNLMQYLKED